MSCKDRLKKKGSEIDCCVEHELTITTYNLGLAHGDVPYAKERLPKIIEALKDPNFVSDVVCMQEVWSDDDSRLLQAQLADKYPYVFWVPSQQEYLSDTPVASLQQKEFVDFIKAVQERCGAESPETLGVSVQARCQNEFIALARANPACVIALMAQSGKSATLPQILENLTQKKAGKFIADGSNGLLILSKYPIEKSDHLYLESFLMHRAALYVQIDKNGEKYHIFTAHTAANMSPLPYLGKFSSWDEETHEQYKQLIRWINGKNIQDTVYLAADLNSSFADEWRQLNGLLPQSCDLFLTAGFVDLCRGRISCSFCVDSNLIILDRIKMGMTYPEGKDLIDHIFVRDMPNDVRTRVDIVFDEPVEITWNGSKKTTNLSDHYGLQASIITYK